MDVRGSSWEYHLRIRNQTLMCATPFLWWGMQNEGAGTKRAGGQQSKDTTVNWKKNKKNWCFLDVSWCFQLLIRAMKCCFHLASYIDKPYPATAAHRIASNDADSGPRKVTRQRATFGRWQGRLWKVFLGAGERSRILGISQRFEAPSIDDDHIVLFQEKVPDQSPAILIAHPVF